jgi:hypothetical protein
LRCPDPRGLTYCLFLFFLSHSLSKNFARELLSLPGAFSLEGVTRRPYSLSLLFSFPAPSVSRLRSAKVGNVSRFASTFFQSFFSLFPRPVRPGSAFTTLVLKRDAKVRRVLNSSTTWQNFFSLFPSGCVTRPHPESFLMKRAAKVSRFFKSATPGQKFFFSNFSDASGFAFIIRWAPCRRPVSLFPRPVLPCWECKGQKNSRIRKGSPPSLPLVSPRFRLTALPAAGIVFKILSGFCAHPVGASLWPFV